MGGHPGEPGPFLAKKPGGIPRAAEWGDDDAFGYLRLPDGLDWLLRPWVEGRCHYESLLDGTLDLKDIAIMNDALDLVAWNRRLWEERNRPRDH